MPKSCAIAISLGIVVGLIATRFGLSSLMFLTIAGIVGPAAMAALRMRRPLVLAIAMNLAALAAAGMANYRQVERQRSGLIFAVALELWLALVGWSLGKLLLKRRISQTARIKERN
jgi:hypothetical protein